MTASELYALSQGTSCKGDLECHWCGSPCERKWLHDDPPPIPFVRSKTTAKRPSSLYICVGCWLFRRPRITVQYLSGMLKDRQSPTKHSWFITEEKATSIHPIDYRKVYLLLLDPPLKFSLSFITESYDNLIQLGVVNNLEEIRSDTLLHFTMNNIPHAYSVYELEEALKSGPEGRMPGVRVLTELLGEYEVKEEVKRGRGRPAKPLEIAWRRKVK